MNFPLDKADLCVKCAMCAPHCPTYSLTRNEAESPRGRIALMAGLAQEQIPASPTTLAHLDHCLSCRACEAVCPAKVPYLELLDAHRANHAVSSDGAAARWMTRLVRLRRGRPLLRALIRLANTVRGPLQSLLQAAGALRLTRELSLLHAAPRRPQPRACGPEQPAIMGGCMGDLCNGTAIAATSQLLTSLGFAPTELPGGICCGALAQHQGQDQAARSDLTALRREAGQHRLIGVDSACVMQLRDTSVFADEICDFLDQHWDAKLALAPIHARVAIHVPCSHRNGLRDPGAAMRLLERIPQIRLESVEDPHCCGAAGLNMLQFPETADALLDRKIDELADDPPEVLATTNIGCALHWRAGLRRRGLPTEVLHPVEILARQLQAGAP